MDEVRDMLLFGTVLLAGLLACGVTTLGIYVIRRYSEWADRNGAYFMSFAAGVLISVSFVHIVPRSFEMNPHAPVFLLLGFLGLYLSNRFLKTFVCHKRTTRDLTVGLIPMLGIAFHSFLDGLIYSVTFNVSVFTGIVAAIGMVLHEFPEGIVTFVLLDRSGFTKRQSTIYAFLAAAVTTPLGIVVSYPFVRQIEPGTLGLLLALSAGALIYVGASHLLPAVEQENKRYTLIALATGILVAVGIVLSK
ncbi:MAG: ZIP family metal transporter [Spirochaetales bacterium]|nr:ZIP family metal transporter [Spirochaetales bacterium]